MDLSKESIHTSLFQFLARSKKYQVWYEPHDPNGVGFSLSHEHLIHAVRDNEHYEVRVKGEAVVVSEGRSKGPRPVAIMELPLDDPAMFTRLEDFFDIGSIDDPARPVDPVKAIADML